TCWMTGQYLAKYSSAKQLLWVQSAATLFSPASVIVDVATFSDNGQDYFYAMEGYGAVVEHIHQFHDDPVNGPTETWSTNSVVYGNIAVGADHAVYMSGVFSGTKDLDPDHSTPGDTLTNAGQDTFGAKWDAGGTFQWVRQLTVTQNTWPSDLAVVNNGLQDTIYVGGFFNGTLTPQGYTGTPLTDQGVVNSTESQDG